MTIRTRVAPSPTGDPHVGTAYVALMNLLFARQNGGAFILRIEDTDVARSSAASERVILESLRWLGLSWDEGPDVGGPDGPYRQSERIAIYRRYAAELVEKGHAFKCYCTPQRLDEMRAGQRARGQRQKYDGHCLHLTGEQRAAAEAAGIPHVVRMVVPAEGSCTFEDMQRGNITIPWETVDMQILLKSDGMPTYHLANVVDDHLMRITHVLRGEEWIASAPKHKLLYDYFGWTMPKLFHLPLLRNPDRSKLSKRKNPTSILFYRRMGYLPEALINFLGLFALSKPEGEEMASLKEIAQGFDLKNISPGGPIFDMKKLDWLNARYIRETLDTPHFLARVQEWANGGYVGAIAPHAQKRVQRLSDLGPLTAFFFSGLLHLAAEQLTDGKLPAEQIRKAFQIATWQFDMLPAWDVAGIEHTLRGLEPLIGAKFRDIVRHFYIAITGSPASVPLFDAMEILGRDLCRERLRAAIATLGGVGIAEAGQWKQEMRGASKQPELEETDEAAE